MIQDATGKFSSRWVLPDRRSLAVLIGIVASVEPAAAETCMRRLGRTPYMGNSPVKPMLSRDFRGAPAYPPVIPGHAPAHGPEIQKIERRLSIPGSRLRARNDNHCPWLVSTWLQGLVSFARFCCRHARMVKSPWSI